MDIQRQRPRQDISHAQATSIQHNQPHRRQRTHTVARIFFILFGLFLLVAMSVLVYIGVKAYATSETVTLTQVTTNNSQISTLYTPQSFASDTIRAATSLVTNSRTPLDGETTGRINILLLGKGNEFHPGKNLTDTLMIASINTNTKKIALLSLPRDFYVHIPHTTQPTKINNLYQYGLTNDMGIAPIIGAVQTLTDLRIHYFLLADFDAFVAVVDALGGVNIDVTRAINDTRYPGPNYSYQTFDVAVGLQKMDGATTLKYVRSRHGDPEGDFGRAKRQQQTLQAIKNKAFSLGTFANPLTMGKLLDAIKNNIRTDMSIADMTSLMTLTKNLDTQNITTVVVDAWQRNSLLRVTHFGRAFGLVPRAGKYNYSEISELATTIFDRTAHTQQLRRIAAETPHITIVRAGANSRIATTVRTTIIEALDIPHASITIAPIINTKQSYTIITDYTNRNKPFTLDALHKLISADIVTGAPALSAIHTTSTADITITLGTDADDTFASANITRAEFEKTDE